jgi:hypothetical protein
MLFDNPPLPPAAQLDPMEILTVTDFVRLPRGPRRFYLWVANAPVRTSFGDFSIEAMMPMGDTKPPDMRMLKDANFLADYVREHSDAILELVFQHYKEWCSRDPAWLEICDVPIGLQRHEIKPYLIGLHIMVDRESPGPEMLITPQWDEEHAIYLEVKQDQLQFKDDSA